MLSCTRTVGPDTGRLACFLTPTAACASDRAPEGDSLQCFFSVDDFTPAVVAAVRTRSMRDLDLTTVIACRARGSFQGVV